MSRLHLLLLVAFKAKFPESYVVVNQVNKLLTIVVRLACSVFVVVLVTALLGNDKATYGLSTGFAPLNPTSTFSSLMISITTLSLARILAGKSALVLTRFDNTLLACVSPANIAHFCGALSAPLALARR